MPGEDWKGLTVPPSPQAPLELLQAFSRAGWACRTSPPAITRTLGGLCVLIKTVLLSSKASSLPSLLAASVLLKVKPSYSAPEKGLNWTLDSLDLMSQSTPLPNCSSVSSTPTLCCGSRTLEFGGPWLGSSHGSGWGALHASHDRSSFLSESRHRPPLGKEASPPRLPEGWEAGLPRSVSGPVLCGLTFVSPYLPRPLHPAFMPH